MGWAFGQRGCGALELSRQLSVIVVITSLEGPALVIALGLLMLVLALSEAADHYPPGPIYYTTYVSDIIEPHGQG